MKTLILFSYVEGGRSKIYGQLSLRYFCKRSSNNIFLNFKAQGKTQLTIRIIYNIKKNVGIF